MIPVQLPVLVLAGKMLSSQLNSNTNSNSKRSNCTSAAYTKSKTNGSAAQKNPLNILVSSLNSMKHRFDISEKTLNRPTTLKNPLNNIVNGLTSVVSQITQPPPTEDYDSIIRSLIPDDAQVLVPKYPANSGTYMLSDLDGDSQNELITSFVHDNELKTLILKKQDMHWNKVVEVINANHDNMNYRGTSEIAGNGKKQLLLGLAERNAVPLLYGYSFEDNTMKKIFEKSYDRFEIIRNKNNPAKANIAIWKKKAASNKTIHNDNIEKRFLNNYIEDKNTHDEDVNEVFIEDSYDIEVFNWNNSQLEPENDISLYYNKNVVPYYVNKVKRSPDAPSNWYNLADSLIKAAAYRDALMSINAGMAYDQNSELKDKFTELKNKILNK